MRKFALIATPVFVVVFLAAILYFDDEIRRWWAGTNIVVTDDVPFGAMKTPQQKEKESQEMENDARTRLAFVSLTARLPKGKSIPPAKPLNADAAKRWDLMDRKLAFEQERRARSLRGLHDKTERFFVESPGAGSDRFNRHSDEFLLFGTPYRDPEQPGTPADFPLSLGETLPRISPSEEFHECHALGLSDFLFPFGFGLVKNRSQVSGFKSHGFRGLRESTTENKRWRVEHVQLVGILSHDHPVVYLTDNLPSMEQVRQGKVRALDYFEEAALPTLRDGEDLYIVQKDDTIRMLGALRATKVCQQCHDAEVGDLLGAFSYTLRPAMKVESSMP